MMTSGDEAQPERPTRVTTRKIIGNQKQFLSERSEVFSDDEGCSISIAVRPTIKDYEDPRGSSHEDHETTHGSWQQKSRAIRSSDLYARK